MNSYPGVKAVVTVDGKLRHVAGGGGMYSKSERSLELEELENSGGSDGDERGSGDDRRSGERGLGIHDGNPPGGTTTPP